MLVTGDIRTSSETLLSDLPMSSRINEALLGGDFDFDLGGALGCWLSVGSCC